MQTISKEGNILVVDDDPLIRNLLVELLSSEGYRKVMQLADGKKVEETVKEHQIDLVLLDITMPGKDGLTITRELRALNEILGIILVTGKGDDIDRIVGIEIGADDYLVKPIQLRDLQARVKNLLQRVLREKSKQTPNPGKVATGEIIIGHWRFDPAKHRLIDSDGNAIALTHGELTILATLTRHPGNIYSRGQLLECISKREWRPEDRTVDVLIGRLRNKIEDNPKNPQYLLTVRGAGYKCIL